MTTATTTHDATTTKTTEGPKEGFPSKKTHFEREEYAVSDWGCQTLGVLTCPIHWLPIIPGCLGTKILIMEEEEAVLKVDCNPFCNIETRRPYGELGSVDENSCCCCRGVTSDLSKGFPIFVGWGCDYETVSEIVLELKRRMKARGDTGQIERTEQALSELKAVQEELAEVKSDLKLVLKALNVPTESYRMER